jgi:ribonuclease HI
MLANTVRGLSQTLLRRLYIACIIPKILYACPSWWNDTKCQARALEKVQRKALRLICAAFKTTPTNALEIEASIPPLQLQAQLSKKRYAIRLNKLPNSSAIIQRLPNVWRENQDPTFPPPIPTFPRRNPKTTLSKLLTHTSHEHERINPFSSPPWLRSLSLFPNRLLTNPCDNSVDSATARDNHLKLITDLKENPNALYVYTDGSKLFKHGFFRVGAAAVAYHMGNENGSIKLGLGGHAEVFDAEMAALAKAASIASNIITDSPNINKLNFFSDSAAAVRAIVDPKPGSAQYFMLSFHNHIRPLLETHPNLTVTVSWCPSHCDIPGNERADTLAKEATTLGCQIPFSTTRSNAKRRSKGSINKTWQRDWKNSPKTGRFAIAKLTMPIA